jgi:metallo-beta-lactamase class B
MKKILIVLFIGLIPLSGFTQTNYKRIKVSNDIDLIKISDHVYVHISYAELPDFGRFPSNGMIYINEGKAFLFDTPVTDSLTKILVSWIIDSMKLKIVGFVPNHWHNDCMGGLRYLQSLGIESYANQMTIEMAKIKGLPIPTYGFKDSLTLSLGDKVINCYYLGAGHTLDNIVVWIPSENTLFGGCMVKEFNSEELGNIVDADLNEWPKTIDKVIDKFKTAKIVIPGHGQFGGLELLQHTRELLTK